MTAAALALILTAAVLHACWNLAAKRAQSGLPVVFATTVLISMLYVPVVVAYVIGWRPGFEWSSAWVVVVSGTLKTGYALFLQRAYRKGDFSVVYPLARGTGPLLAVVAAIALLGERPTARALIGAAIIIASVYVLTGGHRQLRADRAHLRAGAIYGIGTGAFIAAYTIWDSHAVGDRGIAPILFDAGTGWTGLVLLAPFAFRRRSEVAEVCRTKRREILTIALLAPTAYVLILTAMSFTPVSYVAPLREVSMLIGTFLAARSLREGDMHRRMTAAAGMVVGVILLTLG